MNRLFRTNFPIQKYWVINNANISLNYALELQLVEILQADVSKSNFRAFLLTVHCCLFSLQSSSVYGHKEKIRMYALSKLNKQHEQTRVNLQKRLNEVQFSHRKLFPNHDVYRFIKNKEVSVGSCEGYFVPSLLTTTTYLLACNHARVQTVTHDQPLNIYIIFVGYPGTGMFNGLTAGGLSFITVTYKTL